MTAKELLDAGFKCFPQHRRGYEALYQKRITDEHGTRYFIDVGFWQHTAHGGDFDGWAAAVNYNDGCSFHPLTNMRITADVRAWTAQDVIRWADELWTRLAPNYYERDS